LITFELHRGIINLITNGNVVSAWLAECGCRR